MSSASPWILRVPLLALRVMPHADTGLVLTLYTFHTADMHKHGESGLHSILGPSMSEAY